MARYGLENVVEIMGDATGQNTYRLHSLGLGQLGLKTLPFSRVLDDGHYLILIVSDVAGLQVVGYPFDIHSVFVGGHIALLQDVFY